MAGYYPSVIVTLLVIYSNSMNVYCSTYNGDISVIKNNLLLEKQSKFWDVSLLSVIYSTASLIFEIDPSL